MAKRGLLFNQAASRRVTSAIAGRLDLDDLWRDAVRQTDLDLARFGEKAIDGLLKTAPIHVAKLLEKPLDFNGLITRITVASKHGQPAS